jgi:gluconolactonase
VALKHGSFALTVTAVLAAAPLGVGKIERLDPALDALVTPGTVIEKVAGGFKFTEGPLWRPDGTLWFSDVQGNVVRSVTPAGQVKVLIQNAGGVSSAPPDAFIGSNGMAQAPDGSAWMVQHGARARSCASRPITR